MYITGWKGIAAYIGRHIRTVHQWHYERMRIPFIKSTNSRSGQIKILPGTLDHWLQQIHAKSLLSKTIPKKYEVPNKGK